MKFEYSDDQIEIRAVARKMLGETSDQSGVYDNDLWQAFVRDMELLSLHVNEEEGGAGGSLLELSILFSEFGRAVAPLPAFESVAAVESVRVTDFGSEAPVEWAQMITGDRRIGFAIVSDLLGPSSSAPTTVQKAATIDFCIGDTPDIVVVRCGTNGVALIDTSAPGVLVEPTVSLDPRRATCRIILDNAAIAIGVLDPLARQYLDSFVRLLLASELEGISAACLDKAVEYAKLREQYGRLIGSFQAVKHLCANMAIELDGLQPAVMYAALALNEKYEDSAIANRVAFATALETADTCSSGNLQVHGGLGFTQEATPHLYFKRMVFDSSLLTSPTEEFLGIAEAVGISA